MEVLISEIKQRPALWDRTNKLYKMRAFVEKGWKEVAEITGFEKEEAKVKWRNLRDNFLKELKKAPKKNEDGTFQYRGKWRYFNPMSFLLEIHLPTLIGEENVPNSSSLEIEPFILGDLISDIDAENTSVEQEKCSTNDGQPEILSVESAAKKQKIEEADSGTTKTKTLELGEVVLDGHSGEVDYRHPVVEEEDADLDFFKSLLPFMRKLSDLQKLHVRNQFQTILIRQLSAVGPGLDSSELQ
ncbi:uncharacterized protein LOC129224845 [Uloborus diversus]|uniref:uncharacterized protein LOC129224845 n=1 Tax=Uloborus diversus TaxID=327109 RepID=UPI002408F2BB|nr:uncharacterized protein LOC129224845 [Uloborus diversus]